MCLILLDSYLHDKIFSLPPYMGNWRDEVTLEADRRRRVGPSSSFTSTSSSGLTQYAVC